MSWAGRLSSFFATGRDEDEKSRLMKLGRAIGSDLKHFITIVSYNTWLRMRLFDGRSQVADGPAVVGQHAFHRTGILFGSVRDLTAMHQLPIRRQTSCRGS